MKLINMYPDIHYTFVNNCNYILCSHLVQRELPLAGLTADLRDYLFVMTLETKYRIE